MADDKISKKGDTNQGTSNAVGMPDADSDELPPQPPSIAKFLSDNRQEKTASFAAQQRVASEPEPVAVRDTQHKPLDDESDREEELKKTSYYRIQISK